MSVTSRRLLVIDAFDDCKHLLPRLHACGWAVRSCDLNEVAGLQGDVVLIRLHEQLLRRPQPMIRLMRRSAASWVAVLDAPSLAGDEFAELLGEWFLFTHAQPCEANVLLESLMQAQVATRLRNLQGDRRPRQLLGNSSEMRALRKQLESQAGLDVPLLLYGERGSGKMLLAHLLHERSPRAGRAFVCFDCNAQPDGELETRLFGSATTAAAVTVASTGTLVLEGMAELPSTLQRRLLQHLQRHSDLRLLTTSSGELEEAVRHGRFLEELYHLLAGQQMRTVPLRDHRGDLLLLAEHFVKTYDIAIGRQPRRFSDEAIDALVEHAWPGNVRELRHRVLRALVMAQGRQILACDLGLMAGRGSNVIATLQDYILRAERQALNDVLERYSHNMSQAARSLGISRPTFYRLLHKHRLR